MIGLYGVEGSVQGDRPCNEIRHRVQNLLRALAEHVGGDDTQVVQFGDAAAVMAFVLRDHAESGQRFGGVADDRAAGPRIRQAVRESTAL